MDSFKQAKFSGFKKGGEFGHESILEYSDTPNEVELFQFNDNPLGRDIADHSQSSNVPDPITDHYTNLSKIDVSDSILRYIDHILMEDNLEDVACAIQGSTLHAAEQSFYEILNPKDPSSPNLVLLESDACSSSIVPNTIGHLHHNHAPPTYSQSFCYQSCSCHVVDGLVESVVKAPSKNQSGQCNGVIKEKEKGKMEKDEGDLLDSLLTGRKILHQEENNLEEERSQKHLAAFDEESVLHEMFDKVFSLYDKNDELNGANEESQQNQLVSRRYNGAKKGVRKRNAIDTRNLLIRCIESIAANDHKSAGELLRQIRLCSSPLGDGSQRLAHYFANGLEVRLFGLGCPKYEPIPSNISDANVLKYYKLYLSQLPFLEKSYYFADQVIKNMAEKATSIHIIHFHVMFGLQWPPLIQRLSTRPGGPPKLRITGIELPQLGAWANASVKEAGYLLETYCKRFNVPFEYNGISQHWETISVKDLRISKEEVLVVNCLFFSTYLLDDSIVEPCPRDAFLMLIKRMNPHIFIHGIVNGAHNSPFFVSRFREALFYYSALFDMLEECFPGEYLERMMYERDVLANELMNVIACEGIERIVRPETYKQWQIRTLRTGWRQLPLQQDIMKELRDKGKSCHHKNFFVDEASQWMLTGWKGRVIIAVSCWKST